MKRLLSVDVQPHPAGFIGSGTSAVSVIEPVPAAFDGSFTVTVKVNAPLAGIVNVATEEATPSSVTIAPAVSAHAKVIASPSGSLLPDASRRTTSPGFTVRDSPTSTTVGARL